MAELGEQWQKELGDTRRTMVEMGEYRLNCLLKTALGRTKIAC